MKINFFLSFVEVLVGVKTDVRGLVSVTVGFVIFFKSKALNSVPLYLITNDAFLIIPQSSTVKFLSRVLLIVKMTSTDPQMTSRTMTSDLDSRSKCASVITKLNLNESLLVITLQLPSSFIKNVSVNFGTVDVGTEEESSTV